MVPLWKFLVQRFHCTWHFQVHLPSYVRSHEELKAKGVEVIACISVNDVFVMKAWGESQNATGKVLMLADAAGDFAKVL